MTTAPDLRAHYSMVDGPGSRTIVQKLGRAAAKYFSAC
jgi:hypothetical protein